MGTIGLYAAGYHEAAAGDMRIVGMAGVQRGIVVDVVYPAPGKIMARKEDPISWKMSGVGIVPGEEMEVEIFLDGFTHSVHKISVPDDAVNGYVDGGLDLKLNEIEDGGEGFGVGSHNVTILCRSKNEENTGSSIFLYMPKEGEVVKPQEEEVVTEGTTAKEEVVAFDRDKVKVGISQPERHAVVNGDTVVMKVS